MLISHSKKFIFIHNYKVAGTSIETALNHYGSSYSSSSGIKNKLIYFLKNYPKLSSADFPAHIRACELKQQIPENIFNSYFRFGFVRNPWDWQVSLYTFMLKDVAHHQHKLIKSFKNFDEYINWRVNSDLHLQKDFFYDRDGQCLMNFIGKFETIENDMKSIFRRFALSASLPHLNKSREHPDYRHFYNPASARLVQEAFRDDIATFGYDGFQ